MRVLNFLAIALISAVPQLAQSLQSDGLLNPPNSGVFRNLASQAAAQEFPKVTTRHLQIAKPQIVDAPRSCAIPLLNVTPRNKVHYTMQFVGAPKGSPAESAAATANAMPVCPGNPGTGWNAEPAPVPDPAKK